MRGMRASDAPRDDRSTHALFTETQRCADEMDKAGEIPHLLPSIVFPGRGFFGLGHCFRRRI